MLDNYNTVSNLLGYGSVTRVIEPSAVQSGISDFFKVVGFSLTFLRGSSILSGYIGIACMFLGAMRYYFTVFSRSDIDSMRYAKVKVQDLYLRLLILIKRAFK